ncbi:GNAT family N-acetyltransferase [Oscillospiraceae bacterium OttesenSCG-928-F05]|nr:GNAT family N-acetyltransferase [Oscillospiraceae bacterium OttesenSCG-928-F05]
MEKLDTQRMTLVPMGLKALVAACSDPVGALRRMGFEADPFSPDEMSQLREIYAMKIYFVKNYPDAWHFSTSWQMILRRNRAAVGELGFKGPPINETVEIGYSVRPNYRGRQLMTEAVEALCRFALTQTAFPVRAVMAYTRKENLASQKVLKRCGFIKDKPKFGYLSWRLERQRAVNAIG